MPTQRTFSSSGLAAAVLTLAIAFGVAAPASAESITFDFNSLADGNGNVAIQNYMNGVLSGLGLPTGVMVAGAGVEKNYTGDGHVVGPCTTMPCDTRYEAITALTLGNSDGNVPHPQPWDAYIYNADSTKFTITFPFPVYGVSFDYEIFPNAGCGDPNGNNATTGAANCSSPPDFTFKGDGVEYLHKWAVDPFVTPINGFQHSPVSINTAALKEKAAQWLGVSGWIDILGGATYLEFIDWPERVAIDNLIIERSREQDIVPEPATLLLFGTAAAGFFARRKKLL